MRAARLPTIAATAAAALLVCLAVVGALAISGRLAAPGRCPPADDRCLRVLFLGNSYTFVNDLPGTLAGLVRSGGRSIETGMLATGGATLADHAADPATTAALADGRWTVVILQEQSVLPVSEADRTGSMVPAARSLASSAAAVGARPLLLETWAHRDGVPDRGVAGYAAMQARIDAAYEATARDLGASVAPVGQAWSAALRAAPGIDLWQPDGSHPSAAGTYLAACVLYASLTGRTPVGLPAAGGISASDAAALQAVAGAVVLGDPGRWKLPVAP